MPRTSDFKQPRAFRPVPTPFKVAHTVPRTVQWSYWILLSVSALQTALLVWSIATFDWDTYVAETVHSFEMDGQTLQVTPEIAVATVVTSFAVSALGIGTRAAMTLILRRGMNWVRIVLTVLFGILALPPYNGSAFDIMSVVLAIGGVVLVWLPPSNAFFRDVKRDRLAHKAKQLS